MKKLSLFLTFVFILHFVASSQSCLPDGITFTTQEEIDNFKENYPDCSEIEGFVQIEGGNITKLDSLHVLTAIWGDLIIGRYFSHTTNLANLNGLNNIATIGGSLFFSCNEKLADIAGLENLTSIGGNLTVYGNTLLENFQGLENVNTIPGSVQIGTTGVPGNNSLKNLNGLNNITSIGGGLSVSNNDALTNFEGLNNLTLIGGDFRIDLITGDTIVNCVGLENLTSIGGKFEVQRTTTFTSFEGLENLSTVGGDFILMYNYGLIDLLNLNSLTSIGGQIQFYENQLLISFTGLDNLNSVGGQLYIGENSELLSTAGLEQISSLGGDLFIKENEALESLSGLKNIDAASIENLYIFDNPSLSTCEIESVCDFLSSSNGLIDIRDNAAGCNSAEEVEDACNAGIEDQNPESPISIFPNPAQKEIFVSANDGTIISEVKIFNQTGQQVLHEKDFTNPINISILQPGMYVIEVQAGDLKVREKLVVR